MALLSNLQALLRLKNRHLAKPVVFLHTSATYGNKTNSAEDEPSKRIRLIWAIIMSAMALVMMKIGGLAPLSVLNGVIGIPVIIIQFLTLGATIKMMNQDKAWIYNIRKKD